MVTAIPWAGMLSFDDVGYLATGTEEAALLFVLKPEEMEETLKNLSSTMETLPRLWYNEYPKTRGHLPVSWEARFDRLSVEVESSTRLYRDDVKVLQEETTRGRRDIGSWLLGLLNFFTQKDLEAHLENNDEATKITAEAVDVTQGNIRTNEENIHKIAQWAEQEDARRGLYEHLWEVEQNWEKMKKHMFDLVEVWREALNHRLTPAIQNLIPLTELWGSFKQRLSEKNLRPAFQDVRHLFADKTDIFIRDSTVVVVARVPVTDKERRQQRLLHWRGGPIFVKERVMEVRTEEEYLGLEDTGAYTTLTQKEAEDCYWGPEVFCTGSMISYTAAGTSCLQALWVNNWREVARACDLRELEVDFKVWRLGQELVVYARNETTATVTCDGNAEEPLTFKGLVRLDMKDGCQVQTPEGLIKKASQMKEEGTVHIHLTMNMTMEAERERAISLQKTKTMTKVAETVNEMVDRSEHTWLTYFAVGAAIVAVLAVMLFIAFVAYRVQTGRMMPKGGVQIPNGNV